MKTIVERVPQSFVLWNQIVSKFHRGFYSHRISQYYQFVDHDLLISLITISKEVPPQWNCMYSFTRTVGLGRHADERNVGRVYDHKMCSSIRDYETPTLYSIRAVKAVTDFFFLKSVLHIKWSDHVPISVSKRSPSSAASAMVRS